MARPTEARLANSVLRRAAVLAAGLCASAGHAAGAIKVDNTLAQCVTLDPGMRATTDGQVLLQARFNVRQSIGHCGCKSAIATYTSQVELAGAQRSFLQSGSLRLKESGVRTLTLASDEQLVGEGSVVVSLGCARPD